MTKTERTYIVVYGNLIESILRDASSLVLIAALIGLGVFVDSAAMQWMGAIVAFLALLGRSMKGHKRFTSRADAIAYLQAEEE